MQYLRRLVQRIRKVFFGYTTPRCVGIDISSTAIKMVELLPDKLEINNYRIKALPRNLVAEGVINDIEAVSEIIRNIWLEFKSEYDEVAISIPQNAIVVREIKVPFLGNSHKRDEYVKQQLVNDLDNEDIDFDYIIKDTAGDEQLISVVVAKKEKIEEYQAIIQMTGIKVAAIDVENFALQYLFEQILSNDDKNRHIVIIEIGATRIKGFIFIGNKFILSNEMSVNYNALFEDIVTELGDANYLKGYTNIYEYTSELLISRKHVDKSLVSVISLDVAKMLQQLKSNAVVEKKISISPNAQCYLFGGNALIPGIFEEISTQFVKPLAYATELINKNNKIINNKDLMRLFTSISLATWGHKIGQN